jgi:hypothetical protein
VAVEVNVTRCPTSGFAGETLNEALAADGSRTTTVWVKSSTPPLPSFTVRRTVLLPGVANR